MKIFTKSYRAISSAYCLSSADNTADKAMGQNANQPLNVCIPILSIAFTMLIFKIYWFIVAVYLRKKSDFQKVTKNGWPNAEKNSSNKIRASDFAFGILKIP